LDSLTDAKQKQTGGTAMADRYSSDSESTSASNAAVAQTALRAWTSSMRAEALANLAHELRTPLQVLLGYLDILREEWGDQFQPEPRQMLERMNSNLHELSQTVDNVMEFILAEAGDNVRVRENVSLSALISDLMPAIEAARSGKTLSLNFDLQNAPPVVQISRRLLRSILSNLLLNAVKFTERGSVTLRIGGSAESGIDIEVVDTGVGMSPAVIKRAAEPFWQLSESNSRRHRGLGLGLAVVHRNLKALGAKLEVTSTPGEGSRFAVRIPPYRPATAQQLPRRQASRIAGGRHGHTPVIPPPPSAPASPRKAGADTRGPVVFF
jgi:signal transduction histidine kinase